MTPDNEFITENPFAVLVRRINRIESQNERIISILVDKKSEASGDLEPFGDFDWLCNTCKGIPAGTLRIKSAAGHIPGMKKVGKRAIFEKQIVLNWLRSHPDVVPHDDVQIERTAENQVDTRIAKRSIRKAR